MTDWESKRLEKRVDFIVRESRYVHERRREESLAVDVATALDAIGRADEMSGPERLRVGEWAARRALDGFRARAALVRDFEASDAASLLNFLVREHAIGVFADCARLLTDGSVRWERALALVSTFLIDVRDPIALAASPGAAETAAKIVLTKIRRLWGDDAHAYLVRRTREKMSG